MKTALLVIDAQKIYSCEDSEYYVENYLNIVKNINSIINIFEQREDKIIYVKHIHKIDGSDSGRMFDFNGENGEIEFKKGTKFVEFIDELYVPNAPEIIVKNRYDAFIGTALKKILDNNQIERLVITGFMTNFCCESTARSAHDLDYFVDFISDATGTPGSECLSPEDTQKASIATLESGFANILSTSEYIKLSK